MREELDRGIVLVTAGAHEGKIGFYELQMEQKLNWQLIEDCPHCKKSSVPLANEDSQGQVTLVNPPAYASSFEYCPEHKKALEENDFCVIYWDQPYGEVWELIRPGALQNISLQDYERYIEETKSYKSEEKALRLLHERLLKASCN